MAGEENALDGCNVQDVALFSSRSQRAAEWAKRGFSVALPNNRSEVEFDLTTAADRGGNL
jgi:hypothetical protein